MQSTDVTDGTNYIFFCTITLLYVWFLRYRSIYNHLYKINKSDVGALRINHKSVLLWLVLHCTIYSFIYNLLTQTERKEPDMQQMSLAGIDQLSDCQFGVLHVQINVSICRNLHKTVSHTIYHGGRSEK